MSGNRRRRVVGAALVAVLVAVAGIAYARTRPRGAPTAAEAVQRYLDALAARDEDAVRGAFTSDSSGKEIHRRYATYAGETARGARFTVLPVNIVDAPLGVDLTFPAAPPGQRTDGLAVRRSHGRWLLIAEAPAPATCPPESACDDLTASPS